MKIITRVIFLALLLGLNIISARNIKDKRKREFTLTLEELQSIANSIPNTKDAFNCDSWMINFTEELRNRNIKYTKFKFLLRPGKDRGAIVPGAQITFDGKKIGYDSHFFTEVEVDGKKWIFDNINTQGILSKGYLKHFKFYWEGLDSDRMNDNNPLYELPFEGNVFKYRLN